MKKLSIKLIKKEILKGNGVNVIVQVTEHVHCTCGLCYTERYEEKKVITSLIELNALDYREEFINNKLVLVADKEIDTSKCLICSGK